MGTGVPIFMGSPFLCDTGSSSSATGTASASSPRVRVVSVVAEPSTPAILGEVAGRKKLVFWVLIAFVWSTC